MKDHPRMDVHAFTWCSCHVFTSQIKKERTTITFNSRPIGVQWTKDDAMVVRKVASSEDESLGQARQAGIKPGWRLLSVNGEGGDPSTLRKAFADSSLPVALEFEKDVRVVFLVGSARITFRSGSQVCTGLFKSS